MLDLLNLKTLIRADSSSSIGHGHIRRDLVLASKFKNVHFASIRLDGDIFDEINYSKFSLVSNSLDELCNLIKNEGFELLVIDHYGINEEDEKFIKNKTGIKILAFDDTYEPHLSDYVLNVNLYADKAKYKKILKKECKVFCGSKYLLVRDEFYKEAKTKRNKIYDYAVILGGTDILNLTVKISQILLAKDLKTAVITTKANKSLDKLKSINDKNFRLFIDSKNVAKLMNEAKTLIISASSLVNEAYILGAKFKAIYVADNQKEIFLWLKQNRYEAFSVDDICKNL